MEIALALVGAYLLGSVPFAYLVARAKGVNIFAVGTGNPGAANVFRMVSKPLGVLVLILDILKGMGAVGMGVLLGLGEWERIALGGLAIGGHLYPVFLRFRGGAGLATAIGVALALAPRTAFLAFLGALLLLPLIRSIGHTTGLGVSLFVFLGLLLREKPVPLWGTVLLFTLLLVHTFLARRFLGRR
ncbi:MAG: glycerol-3-phosphate acyltransferase [Dehalococcoidia bacterium]|nr:glycerol-3-phosphate acyltransferase [Dehalococcoidia bacterium]MDW8120617.1 glycerol-3-phosphate acyltransferase [Chloroflexota bacterium]